jgi:hypothetical protein
MDDLESDLAEAHLEIPPNLDEVEAYRLASAASFFVRKSKTVEIQEADFLAVSDRRVVVGVPLFFLDRAVELASFFASFDAARFRGRESASDPDPDPKPDSDSESADSESTFASDSDSNADTAGRGRQTVVPWIDATGSDEPEWKFSHALYGEPTIFAYPSRPPRPTGERLLAAERAGWTPTLKGHNLLPGRGIVIEPKNLGLFFSDPNSSRVPGLLVHLATGEIAFYLNPFAADGANDPEMQWWLSWGQGEAASDWKEMLFERGGGLPSDE